MKTVMEHVMEYKKNNPGTVAWRLPKHASVVEKHLNENEKVIFAFAGQKNDKFYDIFTSCIVAVTNKRIIVAQKRVVWGYFLKSITPDMCNDIKVYRGLIWGKIKIDTLKELVIISNVSKHGVDDAETNLVKHILKANRHKPVL